MAPRPPPLPNSYWVVPERLLAGEHPSGPTGLATLDRLQRLLDAGIDFFLDLTEPDERTAYDELLPGSQSGNPVTYLRKPIRDHGLPRSQEQMEEILDALDSALGEGRRIYLHCRAGIGRTNLVAGCWLARGALKGQAVLTLLNELWRASARSQSWPDIPETEAQRGFVRDWRSRKPRKAVAPLAEPLAKKTVTPAVKPAVTSTLTPMAAPATSDTRARHRGLLLGLAIGDAVGQPARGQPAGAIVTGDALAGGGPLDLPAGAWSDKTAMALCLAESFVAQKRMDASDQIERYRRWQREGRWTSTGQCVGISAATARAVATAQWTGNPFSGSHDPAHADAEPLARIGPAVAFAATNPKQAVEFAVNCARITHQAPLTLDTVRYFAALLAGALAGAAKESLLSPYFAPAPGFWDSVVLKPRVDDVALGSWRRSKPRTIVTPSQAATGTLESALWAFERGNSPGECIAIAASLGGDADLRAAIVGELAGAHYGAAALPESWRAMVARGDEIAELADALYAAGRQQ